MRKIKSFHIQLAGIYPISIRLDLVDGRTITETLVTMGKVQFHTLCMLLQNGLPADRYFTKWSSQA